MSKYDGVYHVKCVETNADCPSGGTWKNIGTAYREISDENGSEHFTITLNHHILPLRTDLIYLFPVVAAQRSSLQLQSLKKK